MMINVIRRSQIVGLSAMDRSTATGYGKIEEVWIDESGRVSHLTSDEGYMPLEEISAVGPDAVLSYSLVGRGFPGHPLSKLARTAVRTRQGSEPVGWVEDFLFDWETGDVVAYVVGGDIARPFGDRAVVFPEDVDAIDTDAVVIKEDAKDRIKSEAEGLKDFLSEKSQQVKNLVKRIRDRAQSLITPEDDAKTVRVKVKQAGDELAVSGKHDRDAVEEATQFLEDKWQDLQHRITKAGTRMKNALENAWKRLTK
jgi:sporulation protein YlmC with PRC-barrel domain